MGGACPSYPSQSHPSEANQQHQPQNPYSCSTRAAHVLHMCRFPRVPHPGKLSFIKIPKEICYVRGEALRNRWGLDTILRNSQ